MAIYTGDFQLTLKMIKDSKLMKHYDLNNFKSGWFIGNFLPSIYKNENFEIAVKFFKSGEKEDSFVQLKATEITVVTAGKIKINSKIFTKGSIIEIPPNEPADFKCLVDCVLVCIKFPSIPNDKVRY
jgi:hypothetical protein